MTRSGENEEYKRYVAIAIILTKFLDSLSKLHFRWSKLAKADIANSFITAIKLTNWWNIFLYLTEVICHDINSIKSLHVNSMLQIIACELNAAIFGIGLVESRNSS